MSEINPRYPHWCQIVRKVTDSPMNDDAEFTPSVNEDEIADTDVDDDFDPMGVEDENPVEADEPKRSEEPTDEETETEEDSDEGSETVIIYEGECRSYKINTTSDKGEVITSQRGLALPLNRDGWDELGVVPQEGDKIWVKMGETHEEYGKVIDKNIATAEFAGTHVIWRYVRN